MKLALMFSILIAAISGWSSDGKLISFETDYCTNYPEGPKDRPELWKHCCLVHDMYFWAGGSKQDRGEADLELRRCIEETGAMREARIMYLAVRLGSYSPIKYPNRRWNNGWEGRRGFQSLSSADIEDISTELASGYEMIDPEIKKHFIYKLHSRLE